MSKSFLMSSKIARISTVLAILFFTFTSQAAIGNVFLSSFGDFWLWKFLGRLHPLVVHFPVSLLIVALFLEVFTFKERFAYMRGAINILVIIGSVSAVLGVVFGLLLSNYDEYSGSLLVVHQWLGIATAVVAVSAWYFSYQAIKTNKKSILTVYRIVLSVSVLGVSVAGHYGANITHGENYLMSALPLFGTNEGNASMEDDAVPSMDVVQFKSDAPLTPEQADMLNLQVRTIFAHNCYTCHSSEKIKGELRLDTKEFAFKGGESGAVIIPGHPEKSELVRLISLPPDDKKSMPSKGKKLTKEEVEIISIWIQKGAPWPDNAGQIKIFREAKLEPRNPELPAAVDGLSNPVDLLVDKYFKKHDIEWPEVVDDHVYMRRVYLDVIGLLPTPAEADRFMNDMRIDKREQLVKELLNRNGDYAEHWLTFWNDALRNDYTGTGYIDGGRTQISEWLYFALYNNKPYNQFVKELVSPDYKSKGFVSGIKWRGSVNSSQRTEMQAAQNVSQVFLGLNLKCASCHDSFVSNIKLKDAYAFANIFSDTTLEINRCDKPTGKYAGTKIIFNELGVIDSAASTPEKLKQLADYLVQPKNGRLYRTIVNRMWSQMMGRGLVEPVDVMDNKPWDQDLLDWMAYNFVKEGYDVKKLIYKITTSKAYQLPSVGIQDANMLTDQRFVFKGMVRKRMSAEQFADAVTNSIEPVFEKPSFDPNEKIEFYNYIKSNKNAYPWINIYKNGTDQVKYLTLTSEQKKSYPRLIPASRSNTFMGLKIKDNGVIGYTSNGAYFMFKKVDITNMDKIAYGYGSDAGGYCILHIDSVNGEVVSVANLRNTGGWEEWKTGYAGMKPGLIGKHDLYFVIKPDLDPSAFFDVVWVNLYEKGPIPGVALISDIDRTKMAIEKAIGLTFAKSPKAYDKLRASLVSNNPLLSALGRPNRETVITTRASQASLLQALEFTNGTTLNSVLVKGSGKWKEKYKDTDSLVSDLYKKALGREPKSSEMSVAKDILGKDPSVESIQDLMWAMVLLPEFQLIY
jgi:uncharacterized membrane protein/mono/diheme cytochrome c family protein